MKKISKVLALLLAVMLVAACFAGCGSGNERDEAVVGSWKTAADYEGYEIVLSLDFNEDSTFRMYVAEEDIWNFCYDMTVGQIQAMVPDITDELLDEAAKQMGLNSFKELVDSIYEEVIASGELEAMETAGYWTTDDGSIISYETEEAFNNDERGDENVEPYSLSEDGKELTIYTLDGSEVSMVLTKD